MKRREAAACAVERECLVFGVCHGLRSVVNR